MGALEPLSRAAFNAGSTFRAILAQRASIAATRSRVSAN
jgi:hypothetical protein